VAASFSVDSNQCRSSHEAPAPITEADPRAADGARQTAGAVKEQARGFGPALCYSGRSSPASAVMMPRRRRRASVDQAATIIEWLRDSGFEIRPML
jgi:hypothetical protein